MQVGDEVPDRRIVGADEAGLTSMVARMSETMGYLHDGETHQGYLERSEATVRKHVLAIASNVRDADAFDVIELARVRETPFTLDPYEERLADHLPAAIEVVSLILLARGHRVPDGSDPSRSNPGQAISDLHERVRELLTVGSFRLFAAGDADEFGPLTSLAGKFLSHRLSVRGMQHLHVHDQTNDALFSSSHIGTLLEEAVGFTYEDFLAVRDGVATVHGERFFAAREEVLKHTERWRANGRKLTNDVERASSLRALEDFMHRPHRRATFSAQDVADASGVHHERVAEVLSQFSVGFGASFDPVEAVESFLSGDNPFSDANLVSDRDGSFVWLGLPIGTDSFRRVAEAALKSKPALWRRYERRRSLASEEASIRQLERLLGTPATYTNLKYLRANPGIDVCALGQAAQDLNRVSEQTEADGLFIVEDVAVCVEVKGKSLSLSARQGHVQRLSADLRATVGDATRQANRLEEHIRANGGLWLEDHQWLDLSHVREVRSVAICLDDLGPLAIALDELVRANVIQEDRFPWVVTLHDLTIIAEVIDRPAEFLLYLRRRTESEVSMRFHAVDELDMFMLFLAGGLYVEPDPDLVAENFIGVGPASDEDRIRFRESSIPTQVGTHTDPLDAWIYYREGVSDTPAEKPEFAGNRVLLDLIDTLQDGRKPGWFRFSADLLNLSEEAQEEYAATVDTLVRSAQRDGRSQRVMLAFPGAWGYPTLFVGTTSRSEPPSESSARLATFAVSQKHQLNSDRALVVLLGPGGHIRSVRYDNSAPTLGQALDDAASLVRLAPPEVLARPVPPSARTPRDHTRVVGRKRKPKSKPRRK